MGFSDSPGRLVLTISGVMDTSISNDIERLLASIVDLAGVEQLLVADLSGVTYISSTGIGALVSTLVRARKRNLAFNLARMPEKIHAVFELLGFLQFFTIEARDA
ncbi:MAG: STAS domain-containing protein [Spirochaetota bacterium]